MTADSQIRRKLLVVVSDTQEGSTTGLFPPGEWKGQDGVKYIMSERQEILREQWLEGWSAVREANNKKTDLIIVHNGEAIEGKHHGSIQTVTNDHSMQCRYHMANMEEALDIAGFNTKKDKLFYLSGTDTHTQWYEENIIRLWVNNGIKIPPVVEPSKHGHDGVYIRHELRMQINGDLVWMGHHGKRAGAKVWTHENAVYSAMKNIFLTCRVKQVEVPRLVISSHSHQFVTAEYEGDNGKVPVRGVVTPCYQWKTRFAYKVADPESLPSIGQIYFEFDKNGYADWESNILEKPETEAIVV